LAGIDPKSCLTFAISGDHQNRVVRVIPLGVKALQRFRIDLLREALHRPQPDVRVRRPGQEILAHLDVETIACRAIVALYLLLDRSALFFPQALRIENALRARRLEV
jgi:hypothetical protein